MARSMVSKLEDLRWIGKDAIKMIRNLLLEIYDKSKRKIYKLNPKVHNHVFEGYNNSRYGFKCDSEYANCGFCGKPIYEGQKCWFEGAGGFYCKHKHCKKYWEFAKKNSGSWTVSALLNKKVTTIEEAIKDPEYGLSIKEINNE